MNNDSSVTTPMALEGLRVVDFSHVFQGPVATQLLGDFGADVIKVEKPGAGDWSRSWGPFVRGVSLPYANLNRNKRSLAVDSKKPAGKEVLERLIRSADVLVHNFRSGVMDKLGFSYEACQAINPRLIYATSNGWGDTGPCVDKQRGGHDLMARAEAGWFFSYSEKHPPVPGGISVDYPAGLALLNGILMAIIARERSGLGQRVSTDLLSVAFHAHAWSGASDLNRKLIDEPARVGGGEVAIDKSFATSDGFIEISPVFTLNALREISLALGLGDLSLESRFATESLQIENRIELNALFAERFAKRTTAEWMSILEEAGVLCARILKFDEAARHPQIAANRMVIEIDDPAAGRLRVLGNPLRMSGTPNSIRRHAPVLGEHDVEILKDLGYSSGEIDLLRSEKAIG